MSDSPGHFVLFYKLQKGGLMCLYSDRRMEDSKLKM